jgi:secondary thiamine-phosphate synthase enzyme
MKVIDIKTNAKEELVDLTNEVKEYVASSGVKKGICLVYVPHTTAGVTINENADPSVRADILMTMKSIVSDSLPFSHAEGNSPAHMKSSLIGASINVIIENGNLLLGTWQGIFFCEFDGPRRRRVFLEISPV